MTEQKCMGQKGKRTQMEMTEQYPGYNYIGCSNYGNRSDGMRASFQLYSLVRGKPGAIIWHISAWIMTKWKPQV